MDDRPGGIAELCRCLADVGVTIKDIMHERAWLKDIYSVEVSDQSIVSKYLMTIENVLQVKVVCETRDWEHFKELRQVLLENYRSVDFNDLPLAQEN